MTLELDFLKKLLKLDDDTKDFEIEFIISDVEETIKNYCHIKTIPDGLKNTAYRMCISLYNSGIDGSSEGPVTSIKEGDTTISFSKADISKDSVTAESILNNFKSQLNKYRKMVI